MLEKLLAAILALTAALESRAGATASTASAGASAAVVTVEQAREVMKTLMDTKGKDAVIAALAHVGAKKLGDVKPEDLGKIVAKANELLKATAENLF